tara:strand:- start:68 stop:280 length:213 start_codon:yes stop_codon:yes gene_type:complete
MFDWLYNIFFTRETPTKTPHSFAPLPDGKFYNQLTFSRQKIEEIRNQANLSQKQKQQLIDYEKYFDYYNH